MCFVRFCFCRSVPLVCFKSRHKKKHKIHSFLFYWFLHGIIFQKKKYRAIQRDKSKREQNTHERNIENSINFERKTQKGKKTKTHIARPVNKNKRYKEACDTMPTIRFSRPFSAGSRPTPDPYDQFLDSHGFYRKHTARDPTNLFRVVSEQLYDTQDHHQVSENI